MILLSTENLTIDGFIKVIKQRIFNVEEFTQFVTDFYNDVIRHTEEKLKDERKRLNAIDTRMREINLDREYADEMDFIDERILERSLYIEKIEDRIKYRANANNKRKSRNS